jgi:selenocysteine-specific elongation factor
LIYKLISQGQLMDRAAFLSKPGHEIAFDASQQAKIQTLERKFEQNPFNPPGLKDCQAEVGTEVMNALIETGEFIPVSNDVVFRKPDYDEGVGRIREVLLQREKITLAEVRDLLGTSRKYAQALLEYLDATGLTIRDGDFRRLKRK